jgi:hypothetical protein
MISFGDSIDPNLIPFDYAALYSADCDYPCPPEDAKRWDVEHKRWITFKGDANASILDYEPGTRAYQTPALVRNWLIHREASNSKRRAWIYCDLTNASTAAHYARGEDWQWYIATLDGVRRSRAELSQLLLDYGVPPQYAVPSMVAANQWQKNAGYDSDTCFLDSDW